MDTSHQGALSSLFLCFGDCYALCCECTIFSKGDTQLPWDTRSISPNLTESQQQIFFRAGSSILPGIRTVWTVASALPCTFQALHIYTSFGKHLGCMSLLDVSYSGLWVWFRINIYLLKLFRVSSESISSLWESRQSQATCD